jgi:hypothetical protein
MDLPKFYCDDGKCPNHVYIAGAKCATCRGVGGAAVSKLEEIQEPAFGTAKAEPGLEGYTHSIRTVAGPGFIVKQPKLNPPPAGQDSGCAWCDTQADRCASKACAEYQAALEQRLSVGGAHDCEGERLSVRRFVDARRKTEAPAPTCVSCGAGHCVAWGAL